MTQSEIFCIFHLPLFRTSQAREQPPPRLRSCQRKKKTVYSAKSYTVYTKDPCYTVHMFSYTTCVDCGGLYTCTLYIFRFWSLSPLLRRSSFRVQICGESTLGLNLRDLSVFFSFFEFLYEQCINAVGQTRFNCSDHLFIRGVFSTQPMFQSMEPTGACQVYILPRHQATSIFDKKIWRKKNRTVTFSGKLYIV